MGEADQRAQLQRYQQRLAQQPPGRQAMMEEMDVQVEMAPHPDPRGPLGLRVDLAEARAQRGDVAIVGGTLNGDALAASARDGTAVAWHGANDLILATGLDSLDVELPSRGQVFLFTTPRGEDPEIVARAVPTRWVHLAVSGAVLAGALVVLALLFWLVRCGFFGWFVGRLGSLFLILASVFALCSGVFPVAALAGFVVGLIAAVRHLVMGLRDRRAAQQST